MSAISHEPRSIRYAPAAVPATSQAPSAHAIRRARRAGLFVRSHDLTTLLGLAAALLWWRVWAPAVWEAVHVAIPPALAAADGPRAAFATMAKAGREALTGFLALPVLILAATLLSAAIQVRAFGGPSGPARPGSGGGPAGPPRVLGLWACVKLAMLALVVGGCLIDALSGAGALLAGSPTDLTDVTDVGPWAAQRVDTLLLRLVLLGIPIVVLDVVVQRYRMRGMLLGMSDSRSEQRDEQADPRVRARLRRLATTRRPPGAASRSTSPTTPDRASSRRGWAGPGR